MLHNIVKHKVALSIFIVWLFVISALIGMALGYEAWFIPKTPLNLLIGFGLLLWNTEIDSLKVSLALLIAFGVGMGAEILGVATGKIFGTYSYGANLGPKLMDVPYMIGVLWAVLVVITSFMARRISQHWIVISAIGSGLMVLLDLFIEQIAPRFDFWEFAVHPVPIQNYVSWFVIAFGLHLLIAKWIQESSQSYSLHLYLSQLAFFIGSMVILA